MSFRNPILLIGLIAAVLPLLIYLLTRDKILTVPFSTLRFFAGTSSKLVKRKRWLETLLLLLRAALCALIVFAFARPFLRNKAAGNGMRAGQAVVLAMDVSQSMSRTGVWKQAVEHAQKALNALPSQSAVCLLAFDQSPRVEQTWTDPQHVLDKLNSLQPLAAGTDFAGAMKKADGLLADIAADSKQIILVSDLQRSGWANAESGWKLKPGVGLQIESVAADHPAVVALTDANFPQSLVNDQLPHPVVLRLSNSSDKPAADVSIDLTVAGKPAETQKVTVPPHQTLTAFFRPVFKEVGDHPSTIDVHSGDEMLSHLFFNAHVMPRIAVAIVAPDLDVKRLGSASFFLSKAIRPSDDSAFDVQVLPASGATSDALKNTSVVIVCDVPTPSTEMKQAIADVLHRGGGLLLLPGEKTLPQTFAEAYGSVAPCQLRRIIQSSETRHGGAKALITRVDLDHPIFEVFQRPHSGDFSAVEISRYWEVTDSQLSRVPMRLDDGRPYMLETSVKGGGNSLLIVSPPELSWNNLPQRAIFLPMLQQTLRYLALRGEQPTTYQVGDILPIPQDHQLRDPDGKTHDAPSLSATAPGSYTLLDKAGKPTFAYAVNTPLAESDTATIPPDELRGSLESTNHAADGAGSLASLAGSGREFWAWLIGLSLCLVVVELFVANKVPRH